MRHNTTLIDYDAEWDEPSPHLDVGPIAREMYGGAYPGAEVAIAGIGKLLRKPSTRRGDMYTNNITDEEARAHVDAHVDARRQALGRELTEIEELTERAFAEDVARGRWD